ncbi:MAG: restriction endonuclease subunit S [Prevotella sp.]|nr:restriction endonuclease subunit S [Prevotella sp.]
MEEWKEYKLGEICKIFTGKKDVNQTTIDGLYPFFSCAPTPYQSSEYIYDGKAIIVAGNGSFTGRVSYYIGKFDLYQRTYACVPSLVIFDFFFLFYYMKAYFEPKYMGGTRGSSIPYIVKGDLTDFKIKLPTIAKQQQIASILKSLDDKIEVNRKINENLEQQAQALFKSWFVDFEPFKNGEFVESELGMIPKGWRVGKLSEIADVNPYRNLKKGINALYLDMKNMPTKGSFPMNWDYKLYSGGMKFKNEDTLMARITPCLENGKVAYVNFLEDDEIAFGSTEYIVMTPKDGFMPELLYFLCRDDFFKGYATKNMNGSSGRQRVSAETIGKYPIAIPPKVQIESIASYYKGIMDNVKKNGLESRRLASLRDTLLPKLMSGELKVNEL